MIGTIRGFVLNKDRVYCKADDTGEVLKFVVDGLKDKIEDYIPSLAIGFYKDKELIGGALINAIRPGRDCWCSIYTNSPLWGKRHILRHFFSVVFCLIEAKRCSVFVSVSNQKSYKLGLRLGFKKEGILRQYRDNGEDCYVMGMLKKECIWL